MASRVLIVDDSASWRTAIRRTLSDAGFDIVAEAADGVAALEAYARDLPDLVTLDIQMPVMNGLDCLEELRLRDPHARIVMVTGTSGDVARIRARELGAAGFVAKPYAESDLLQSMREALL